jgi:lipopolysaccharide biosynthesis protein
VVMHIFYPELAGEMRGYLENIPGPVDLYMSTDTEEKRESLQRTFAGWTAGQVDIRLAPNRGRDIAPKLIAWRDVYDRHAVVLHLHSKKSPHESNLRMWRYFLFENLLGEPAIAASILSALEQVPTLGMVASEHYFAVSNGIGWGDNLDMGVALAARMGLNLDPHAALDFPSGSMFWAKSAAIRPLLDLELAFEDFPAETGQKDGTLAHAIERLYLIACQSAGFDWIQVSRGRLADRARPPPALIGQVSDLVSHLGQ